MHASTPLRGTPDCLPRNKLFPQRPSADYLSGRAGQIVDLKPHALAHVQRTPCTGAQTGLISGGGPALFLHIAGAPSSVLFPVGKIGPMEFIPVAVVLTGQKNVENEDVGRSATYSVFDARLIFHGFWPDVSRDELMSPQ